MLREGERIAMSTAAVTFEMVFVDMETRRFLAVEWTAANLIAPGPFKLDVPGDQIPQRRCIPELG